jgi:phosphoribosylpyrophosphate synthetase
MIARDGIVSKTYGSVGTYVGDFHYDRQDSNFEQREPTGLILSAQNYFTNSDYGIVCDAHNRNGAAYAIRALGTPYQPIHFAALFSMQGHSLIQQKVFSLENCIVMGLDKGGVDRITGEYISAIRATTNIAMPDKGRLIPHLDKRRDGENKAEFYGLRGISSEDITGKDIWIFEDKIDTGGSVIKGGRGLKELGARSVTVFATNGLFSSPRIDDKIELLDLIAGKIKIIKRTIKNPDPIVAIREIDESARDGQGIDAIFVSNQHDYALTEPELARAIDASPVIHRIDVTGFIAHVLMAFHNSDRDTNSISHRLSGDPAFLRNVPFQPVALKPDGPLRKLIAA